MKEEYHSWYHRSKKNHKGLLWTMIHTKKLSNLEEMDKILETYNLSGLNHDEIEKWTDWLLIRRLNQSSKTSQKTSPGPDGFTGEFYLMFKEELIINFSQTLPKIRRKGNSSKYIL